MTAPACFIVGMPRAATTWLCKCLNEHPDAAAFGETLYWGRRFVPPREDGSYGPDEIAAIEAGLANGSSVSEMSGEGPGNLRQVRPDAMASILREAFDPIRDAAPTPGAVFGRLARAIGDREDARVVIEKTPHHLNWIERIESELPGSRYVVMVREPYSFMLSYKHQGDRRQTASRRAFERRYHPIGCALVWRRSVETATAVRNARPDQVLIVRQRDLQEDPRTTLDRVQMFFGLDPVDLSEAVPRDNTSFPEGPRPELAAADVFWMNRLAGRVIRSSGYDIRPARGGWGGILWSAVRLPWWAFRNAIEMRGRVSGSTTGYLWRWIRGG